MSKWTLTEIKKLYGKHLHIPDTGAVDVTLATIVANLLPGKPVFTLLIGGSGGGKSTQMDAVRDLSCTYSVDTFTEAGLLSGASDGTPGLLKEIEASGTPGILLFSDLTVLLSKSSDEQSASLGLARRVYDGYVDRRIGTGGGKLEWEAGENGRVGCLAGVTEVIYETSLGSMGERFVYYPLAPEDDEARWAVSQAALDADGNQPEYERERRQAVTEFLGGLTIPTTLPAHNQEEKNRLSALADLGSRCRSVVKTDERTGAIRLVYSHESTSRLTEELHKMSAAFKLIGTPDGERWRLLIRLALGGIHPIRRMVITLLSDSRPHTPATIAGRIGLDSDAVKYHLRELAALGVIEQDRSDREKFAASEWLCVRWRQAHGEPEPQADGEPENVVQLTAHFPGIQEVDPDALSDNGRTNTKGKWK